ncbi:UNVERIFIED_CONTAM: hypothetical protein GTU68_021210, partial [Idotea baltica]|nr:hypothetical protein [Idotea baltica]
MIFHGNDSNIQPERLLSIPSAISETDQTCSERSQVSYKNLSEKYVLGTEKNSSRQYFEMYSARLEIMKPKIEAVAKKKWGNIKIKKLHELEEQEVCVIVGTLFKR